jgi:oligoribonuclease NrnB/cAMP/cGMP phosphodiesterase (DHH superfamily)
MYGIDYGEPFPWAEVPEGRRVIMVDFSLNEPADMKKLAKLAGHLTWIDHHATAIAVATKLGWDTNGESEKLRTRMDTALAACELTWDLLMRRELPQGVWLLGRYDVWAKDHESWEDILDFQYGLRSVDGVYNVDNPLWASILGVSDERFLLGIRLAGRGIRAYLSQELAQQAGRGAFVAKIDGLTALCLNTATLGSAPFDSVWDPEKHDLMVSFFQRADGTWRHGFYTTKDNVDCSALAKAHGGGGHKAAAGCIDKEPLVKPEGGEPRGETKG